MEWQVYTDHLNVIIDSHGKSKCEGLRGAVPCTVCNIKHGDGMYGSKVRELGDWVQYSDPIAHAAVELDLGFDPNVYDDETLRKIAEEHLAKLTQEPDHFADYHFDKYGATGPSGQK